MTSPTDPDYKPKLRSLDIIHLVVEGRPVIGLKDPLQLREETVCIGREAVPVVAMFDGQHSLRDIQVDLTRRHGRIVFLDDLQAILERLNDAFLLEGDRFRQAFENKVAEYRRRPSRPASHAGTSYSADPETLRNELSSYFTGDGGPGLPEFFSDQRRPVGLIAPHIDIRAGGRCFAAGYHALATGQPSDVYVILGTGHAGVEGLFTATTHDFETPLGTVPTDRQLLSELSSELGRDTASEEILHATEHVIEFQVIFLQYLFGGRHPFTIVPILCSLSHHFFSDDGRFLSQRQALESFCLGLKEVCRRSSRSVCFVASADLDHIGPRYGDSFNPHEGTIAECLEKDAVLLTSLEKVDLEGFIGQVARENDSRRICGFSPITAMLHCMDASEGHRLALDYARVDVDNSFVSFASVIFH
ncbi:MAG: AmmeMemoRadiSam system protein B [Desulfomonilaceae bacterium]